MNTIFGIILIVFSVFLVVAVLMQSGKDKRLSGSIAGGAETFFGKSKGGAIDKKLSRLTTIIAVLFVCIVVITYVVQDDTDLQALLDALDSQSDTDTGDDHDHSDGGEDTSGGTDTGSPSGEDTSGGGAAETTA